MSFIEDNRKENQRLHSILKRLSPETWSRKMNGGWTVATMLCHLAFWDKMTVSRIQRWRETGKLTAVPDMDNVEVANISVRSVSEGVTFDAGAQMVSDITNEMDALVEKLTDAELKELESTGRERWYQRSLHRKHHLDKIEQILG